MPISNYQIPGVYVTQTSASLTSVSPTTLTVAIVADQVTPGNQTDTFYVPTAASGITIGQLSVPMVNTTSTGTYTSYSGFTLTWVSGTTASGVPITATGTYGVNFNISTTSGISTLNTTGISVSGTSTLPSGALTLQYGHNWGAYGTFNSQNAVVSAIGPAISGTTIANPAVLASQFAFQNGASVVKIVPVARINGVTVASDQDWTNTFTASTSGSNVIYLANTAADVIVPLHPLTKNGVIATGSDATVASGISNYINTQANKGVYQRAFLGIDGTTAQTTVTGYQTLASNLNNSRISLVYPPLVNYNPGLNTSTGLTNANINIAGYYISAALAGTFVGQQPDVSTPITNKQVYGFNDVPNQINLLDAQASYLPYGVLVVRKKNDGNFWVLHGITTNVLNWLTQEISIGAIGDRLTQLIRIDLINSYLVGGPLTKNTSAAVLATVQATLTNALSNGLIQAYQNLNFTVNPATPTTITVSFQYAPTFPINYIQANVSLNTQTGQVVYGNTQSNFVVY
jgi:hypothetical protein